MINPLVDKPVDKPSTSTRDVTINIRSTQAQRDLIDAAAAAHGKSRSEFMLECAYQKAQEVLLDRTFFNTDEDQFNTFLARLDEPPVYHAPLQDLLATKSPWE